ncbi:24101_t:CDS:2, partial [Cetraspora pellucida]
ENIKKVRHSYTLKEKANVVRYALREGNLRATAKFDLDKTQVGYWVMKLKGKLDEVNYSKSHRLEGVGQRWAKTKASSLPGVIVFFHEKGWMNEPSMLLWANNYIEDCLDSQKNKLSLLVFDSFRVYITNAIKKKLQENNNDLVVISGRLTSVCQLLDVSINCPFKVALLCEWVLATWAEIDPKIIHHAFRKCSISNIMDKSEDSEIYHDKILDNKTNEANENNPNMDSGNFGKNEEDFKDKENNDATIEENKDVLLFTID